MTSAIRHPRRRPLALLIAVILLGSLTFGASPQADAMPVVIAGDLLPGGSVGLVSFANDAPAFSSTGDGFQKFQRNVSPTIPFAVLDDSLVSFPGDTAGIVDDNNLDEFFGIVDTENADNSGDVSATWVFDIVDATDLAVSIDMGAMGDFETNDTFEWTASIDGAPATTLFSLVVDEAASRTYTLANGTTMTPLDDPLNVGAIELDNILQTVTAPLAGTGSELSIVLTASTDGGSEGVAFQNLIVTSGDAGPAGPMPGDLVITEVIQNPNAVSDGDGEWFEVTNVTDAAIDLDGWTIRDNDSDSHVIAGTLIVAPGAYVVLGNNDDPATNGGVTVDYDYGSSWFLSNSADEVVLVAPDGTTIDAIEYDGGPVWPDPTGASMNLAPESTNATANNDGANWCVGTVPYGGLEVPDLGTPGSANTACEVEPPELALIHAIQGSGDTVAISGPVQVQAVVTSLFERDDVLDGFFVQEEDADADADTATSEGIFVFCRGNCPTDIAVGDLVTVDGNATDFFGMSQVDMSGGSVVVDSSGNALPTAISVDLPAPAGTDQEATFENIEGMVVTFPDTLAVSEYFQFGRFGQIVLTETARPQQFTDENLPDPAGYAAFLADLATRRIVLDDEDSDNNDPTSDGPDEAYPYGDGLSVTNRFRGGDTITDLTGVMHWSFPGSGDSTWRIRPIQDDAYDYTFTTANPAPTTAPDVGGSIQVASFNVLNLFSTVDLTSSNSTGDCGPSATLDCRGADSAAELERQQDKIIAAIGPMDAEVVGLIELENDGDDASISALVDGLNASVGAGTYDYVATGFIGSDAIKVGYVYQPAEVSPVGDYAILDSSVDPNFLDSKNRPVLIQTFEELATGEKFTVAVNHFKSKGSSCDDVGDPGLNDGQASCPGTRTAAAIALADYLATDPTGSGDADFLILGDLNSYAMEDPIVALAAAGYTDLLDALVGSDAYSYVFDGQLGYLDYALANDALLDQVAGVAAWPINADEVSLFDYNDDIDDTGEASFERESTVGSLYAADALRSSDHDPVIVGLSLMGDPVTTCNGLEATHLGTSGDDTITGTAGPDVIVGLGGNDTIRGFQGNDVICGGDGDDNITGDGGSDLIFGGDGNDTITSGQAPDEIYGGAGDDNIRSGSGADLVDGGPDNDTIRGGNKADVLRGGDGNDVIRGGNGNDEVFGEAGDDTLFGGWGRDLLDGGDDTDSAAGAGGFDTCIAETTTNCEL